MSPKIPKEVRNEDYFGWTEAQEKEGLEVVIDPEKDEEDRKRREQMRQKGR